MSRWRVVLVLALLLLPFLTLAGAGSYGMWTSGLGLYVWWPLAACMSLGYLLGWYWSRQKRLLKPIDLTPPLYWTDRDRQAWKLVEARAQTAPQMDAGKMTDFDHYVAVAKDMALELARFYHPGTRDPIAQLTIPESLTVIELASHDMAEAVDRYLPGGHLLTVRNWRQAQKATEWYQTASNAYWLVSALFSPVNTGLRYAASKMGLSRPWQMLQQNLLVWLYTLYLHRLGSYLIDLNSGRLRVGAERYRELMGAQSPVSTPSAPSADGASPPAADPAEQVRRVTLTLMGQVKAGKSSLINTLLGEQRALTDVVPATAEVARYELQPEGIPTRLVLLDTVGYGHTGPKEDQLRATREAAQQSDLLLLVLHARNPARQADLDLLKGLRRWFADRPDLKMPPTVGVLTHIDLLSPALEWSPPYNWQQPERLKEQQIAQALAALREQLGDYLVGVVPACTTEGKVYGVEQWLLPVVTRLLDEAHAVALLRCLRAEIDTGKVRKVFAQLKESSKQVAQVLWQTLAP